MRPTTSIETPDPWDSKRRSCEVLPGNTLTQRRHWKACALQVCSCESLHRLTSIMRISFSAHATSSMGQATKDGKAKHIIRNTHTGEKQACAHNRSPAHLHSDKVASSTQDKLAAYCTKEESQGSAETFFRRDSATDDGNIVGPSRRGIQFHTAHERPHVQK